MTINIKRALLTGTAIVAVGAIGVASSAQAQTAVTAAASGTWASSGAQGDDGTIAQAVAGANLDITGDAVDITVTNDTTADDGSGDTNTFALGTVTDSSSAQDGDLTVTSGTGADLTVTIGAATLDGNVVVQNQDANNSTVDTTVTNNLTVGGTLDVTNQDVDAADTVTLDVDGNVTVTGATTVTAAAGAANDGLATLEVAGNATFTGGLTLDDDAGGAAAQLTLDGSTAQTVTGTIDGGAANEGAIVVSNASGATFLGAVGGTTAVDTIVVAGSGANAEATFRAAVSATSITLGDGAGTDSNSVTFRDATGFTVTGTVDGTAGDTDTVAITGGGTIVQAGVWGGGGVIDSLTVSGSGTELDSDAALTVTTAVVGSGATLDVGAGLLTGDVTLSGTVNFTGTGGMTGDITGASGTVDVDEDVTITGDITNVNSITVATTKTLDIDHSGAGGSISANTITLENGGTLNLDSDANTTTVTGNIVSDTASAGTITIQDDGAGTTAFVGNIGSSSASLAALTLNGGNNNTVTATGNVFVDAIVLDDADVLQLLGTSAQAVSGTINAVGGGDGVLRVGNGTAASVVTFNGIIGGGTAVDELDVTAAAEAIFNADATIGATGATFTGTARISEGVTVTAATNTTAAGTLDFEVSNDAPGSALATDATTVSSGLLDVTGGADITSETITISVASSSAPILDGQEFQIIEGNGTTLVGGPAAVETAVADDSFIYDFVIVDGTGANIDSTGDDGDLFAIASLNDITAGSDNTNNAEAATVLLSGLSTSTDTQINLIQGVVASAGSQEDFNEAVEATQPTVDGGAVLGGFSASTQSLGVTGARLASLRGGDAATGVAAGNHGGRGLKAWGQVFGSTAEQDDRDGIDGYEADTYGIAVGVDSEDVFRNTVIGLGFSYADTDVDSDNANNTETELDSYQITLYGDHDLDDRTYVSGMLAYAYNDIDQQRFNVGGVGGLTADADFDSDQIIVYSEVGRDYEVGQSTTITPHLLAHYQHIEIDGYTETGAGGANLTVDTDDMDIFEIGLGATVEWISQNADGSHIKPNVHAEVRHDLVGDEVESSSTFQAGGASFSTEGADPAETSFNMGAGITWYTKDHWELTAAYDFNYKEDYDSHSGLLRAGYRF